VQRRSLAVGADLATRRRGSREQLLDPTNARPLAQRTRARVREPRHVALDHAALRIDRIHHDDIEGLTVVLGVYS
jgi:hypothetical protein